MKNPLFLTRPLDELNTTSEEQQHVTYYVVSLSIEQKRKRNAEAARQSWSGPTFLHITWETDDTENHCCWSCFYKLLDHGWTYMCFCSSEVVSKAWIRPGDTSILSQINSLTTTSSFKTIKQSNSILRHLLEWDSYTKYRLPWERWSDGSASTVSGCRLLLSHCARIGSLQGEQRHPLKLHHFAEHAHRLCDISQVSAYNKGPALAERPTWCLQPFAIGLGISL